MSGDNKVFTVLNSDLFAPATLTKKSPKTIRYDPIAGERKEFRLYGGVMKAIRKTPSMPPFSQTNDSSQASDFSPFRSLNSTQMVPPSRHQSSLAQTGYFSLNSSPSIVNITYAKTRAREETFNPITGVKAKFGSGKDQLESLGTQHRIFAAKSKFASTGDLRTAYDLSKGEGARIAGAKRMPVNSVAYVNLYDLKG